MRCIRTLGFTAGLAAVAMVLGAAAGAAATGNIANGIAATHSLASVANRKITMRKSRASGKARANNALRSQAAALTASIKGGSLALAEQKSGRANMVALRAGLTSRLGSATSTFAALAPKSKLQGGDKEAAAFAMKAKTLVDSAGAVDRVYSLQPK